jgi:hypothetical protein
MDVAVHYRSYDDVVDKHNDATRKYTIRLLRLTQTFLSHSHVARPWYIRYKCELLLCLSNVRPINFIAAMVIATKLI